MLYDGGEGTSLRWSDSGRLLQIRCASKIRDRFLLHSRSPPLQFSSLSSSSPCSILFLSLSLTFHLPCKMDLPAVAAMVRSSPSYDRGCYNTSSGAPSPKEIPLPGARPPFIHGGSAAGERRPPFIHGGLATGERRPFCNTFCWCIQFSLCTFCWYIQFSLTVSMPILSVLFSSSITGAFSSIFMPIVSVQLSSSFTELVYSVQFLCQ